MLYIDVMCISIDGIPFDCALLSIITALRNGNEWSEYDNLDFD